MSTVEINTTSKRDNHHNFQLTQNGKLRHFLTIQGLPANILHQILDTAESFLTVGQQAVKKVPLLRGKTIANVFFEPSTRTRTTFELAEKRLSADVLTLNIANSSTTKGETLMDTLNTLHAMHSDMFVVRHEDSGSAHFIAKHSPAGVGVINAGDGRHAHPTQAMLDMLTIRRTKQTFQGLSVAIVGDIKHSRVARCEIQALKTLGVKDIRIIAPKTLMLPNIEQFGITPYHAIREGLKDVDVIIMLRLQKERMANALLPSEHEYFHYYGLTEDRVKYAKPDVIIMHPGPINRGIEIASEVADGPNSVILQQITHGIAVRMAVMSMVLTPKASMEHEHA